MKIFKSILIVALALFTLSTIKAQSDTSKDLKKAEHAEKSPDERAEKQTERLVKRLELSDDQAAQIKRFNIDYAKENQGEREARKAKRKEHQERIRATLTAEQAEKYDKGVAKHKKKRKHKKGKKGAKRKEMKKDGKSDKIEKD